jgi:hypothetical protein
MIYYLIGENETKELSEEGDRPDVYSLIYCPECTGFPLCISVGRGRAAYGTSVTAENLLSRPDYYRFFKLANAFWFVPFVKRLANGEKIDVAEIEAAYLSLFGSDLPRAPVGHPFS